jgi:hypothetical protein
MVSSLGETDIPPWYALAVYASGRTPQLLLLDSDLVICFAGEWPAILLL